MKKLVMPPRTPSDGTIRLQRGGEERLLVTVVTDGEQRSIDVGIYNAWRLFGMLALFLEIPLPKRVGKAVRLSEPGDPPFDFEIELPARNLGERVAQYFIAKKMRGEK